MEKEEKKKRHRHEEVESMTLRQQMNRECLAMAKFAFASGLKVPGYIPEKLEILAEQETVPKPGEPEQENMKQLNAIHATLSRIVAPATPRTILLMETEKRKKGFMKFLGVIPFIRRMILVAIIALVMFVLISLSPEVNDKPAAWNLFESSGFTLLLRELFLLSAAAIGAAFAALFKANHFVIDGTFDPRYESSYWIRFIVGIIAGMLLATLIPIEKSVEADFAKPLLAMLGGFSAEVVYGIFERLVETVASFFSGDTRETSRARDREMQARSAEEEARNRFQLASNLTKMQEGIEYNSKPEEIKKKIGSLIGRLTAAYDDSGMEG